LWTTAAAVANAAGAAARAVEENEAEVDQAVAAAA